MEFKHFVVTFDGTSKPLTTDATIVAVDVTIQAGESNTHAAYLGGRNSTGTQVVTSSDYGIRIPPITAAGDPAPPYPLAAWNKATQINLSKIYAIGTSGEKLFISYWAK